MDQIIREWKI